MQKMKKAGSGNWERFAEGIAVGLCISFKSEDSEIFFEVGSDGACSEKY